MDGFNLMAGLWNRPGPSPASEGGSTTDETARSKADQAGARIDRALLTMEAIWSLLRDRFGFTDEQLVQRVVDLDLSDGQLDGRHRRPPMQCPSCKRVIPRRFPRCLYCGTDIQYDPFA